MVELRWDLRKDRRAVALALTEAKSGEATYRQETVTLRARGRVVHYVRVVGRLHI